jgi:hypothetical protein
LEATLVFFDVVAGIPFNGAKVEDFFAVEVANAAWAGAEAVDEPGDFVEGFDLKDADIFFRAFGPAGGEGFAAGLACEWFAGFAARG